MKTLLLPVAAFQCTRTSRHGDHYVHSRRRAEARRQYGQWISHSPGYVQRMTAGTGVRHSEKNNSDVVMVRRTCCKSGVLPNAENLAPGYEQKAFSEEERRGQMRLIASGYARYDQCI